MPRPRAGHARPLQEDRGTTAARISGCPAAADAAHATEIVVEPLPPPHGPALRLELGERRFVDARLGVDHVGRGVNARARDDLVGLQALVEDPREHGRERRTQPGRPRGADRERQAFSVECQCRSHPALEVVAGLWLPERDVRLPEEVVELHVQLGDPYPCPDAEAVGEDARPPVPVHGDHVGRVLRSGLGALESRDEGEYTIRLRESREPWQPREELGNAGEAAACRDPLPVESDDDGIAPPHPIFAQIARRDPEAVDRQQPLGERTAIDARRALLCEGLHRLHEPRLPEGLTCVEHRSAGSEELSSALEREDAREHLQRANVHLG